MSDMIQFVAQLMVDVGRRDAKIQRALQVLQKLDRYNVEPCSRMEWSKQGDWVDFASVSKAIDILREGQQ